MPRAVPAPPILDPIVQPIGPALPELDDMGDQEIATPSVWEGDGVGVLPSKVGYASLEFGTRRDLLALLRSRRR